MKCSKAHKFLAIFRINSYYLDRNDHSMTKNALTELYLNLSYLKLSRARDVRFGAFQI